MDGMKLIEMMSFCVDCESKASAKRCVRSGIRCPIIFGGPFQVVLVAFPLGESPQVVQISHASSLISIVLLSAS